MSDADLVQQVRQGEAEAFTVLVNRYQNAIYGLAYHHLGNFEDARDAAQETFIRAYSYLHLLSDPHKFGPWLRQVAVNECRMSRRRQRNTEPLEAVLPLPDAAQQVDTQVAVQEALSCLSDSARLTITLFYMQSFSMRQIAEFLEIPVTTVKSRLRDARARLKKEMWTMVEDTMKQELLTEDFAERVQQLIEASSNGGTARVKELLEHDPALVNAEGSGFFWYGDSPALHLAVRQGHRKVVELLLDEGAELNRKSRHGWTPIQIAAGLESRDVVELLLSRGAQMDIFTAEKLDDIATVKALLEVDPGVVHARGPWGATPLHVARTVEVAQLLLDSGADIDVLDDFYQSRPVDYQCYNPPVRQLLIERGAKVDIFLACYLGDLGRVRALISSDPTVLNTPAAKHHRPGQGATPLGCAAQVDQVAVAELLLDSGADVNAAGVAGITALHWAGMYGQRNMTALLLQRGADTTAITNGATARWENKSPLDCAIEAFEGGLSFDPDAPDYKGVIELFRSHVTKE